MGQFGAIGVAIACGAVPLAGQEGSAPPTRRSRRRAEPAQVTGQAFGDPGAVQVLEQRDHHPPGGAQRLACLRRGERLRRAGRGRVPLPCPRRARARSCRRPGAAGRRARPPRPPWRPGRVRGAGRCPARRTAPSPGRRGPSGRRGPTARRQRSAGGGRAGRVVPPSAGSPGRAGPPGLPGDRSQVARRRGRRCRRPARRPGRGWAGRARPARRPAGMPWASGSLAQKAATAAGSSARSQAQCAGSASQSPATGSGSPGAPVAARLPARSSRCLRSRSAAAGDVRPGGEFPDGGRGRAPAAQRRRGRVEHGRAVDRDARPRPGRGAARGRRRAAAAGRAAAGGRRCWGVRLGIRRARAPAPRCGPSRCAGAARRELGGQARRARGYPDVELARSWSSGLARSAPCRARGRPAGRRGG